MIDEAYHILSMISVCVDSLVGYTIDLVLLDPQSVGKRTHDLMDTVNAKKRWKTICWRVSNYLKYSFLLTRFGKEQS
jgi:hypothetical protein